MRPSEERGNDGIPMQPSDDLQHLDGVDSIGGTSSSAGQGEGYDDEPVLKYQRMGADVGKLLADRESEAEGAPADSSGSDAGEEGQRETILRMAVHDSYLVFGTATGSVLLTDYHGNETRRLHPHTKAVTDLSMDITGDFLASCSEDGTVVVTGLQPGDGGEQTPPEVYSYGAKWPMLAVRLDPLYARRKDKTFVAGGAAGKLLLNKKGWLGHAEVVLHKGEGPVSAIAWRGPLVAWASDGGIKIMDVDKGKGGERISYVDKYPHSLKQRATAYSLAVAMDFSEALRSEPGFRLGFNSGGSSASVNHLHFQCWHFDAGPRGLAIEVSPSTHAATIPLRTSSATSPEKGGGGGSSEDSVEVHTLEGYPIMGLVFHTLGKDLEAVGEVIERCINVLIESNTPHTMLFSTGRAFLLPRQPLEEPPFAVVPGFPEVSGEVIVTAEEDFPRITADDVYRWWQEKISVGAEQFGQITRACLS